MNENDYLRRLKDALSGKLPDNELRDVLDYYREYFAEGGEEAASSLEPPEVVARTVLEEHDGAEPSPAQPRKRFPRWAIGVIVGVTILAIITVIIALLWSRFAVQKGDALAPALSSEKTGDDEHGKIKIDVPFVDISVDIPSNLPSINVGIPSPAPTSDAVTSTNNEMEEEYDSIKIDVPVADIIIEMGDSNSIQTETHEGQQLDCEVKNGTLYVTGKLFRNQANIKSGFVLINLPKERELKNVEVAVNMGNITLSCVTARTMELSSDMGNVTLSGCTALEKADCTSDMGDIWVDGSYPCTLKLESDMGNISAAITGASADYGMSLSADMGAVTLNGEAVSNSYTAPKSRYSLTAEADMGNVTVDFTD